MPEEQGVIQGAPAGLAARPAWVCVIAPCVYVRTGLRALLSASGRQVVTTLSTHDKLAAFGGASDVDEAMLVCHLPARLGAMLDTLFFVAACLVPGAPCRWRRIVLLTTLPPCWLFDSLCALTEDAGAAGGVEVISPCRPLPVLRAVLTEDVRLPLAAQTRRLWRCALTAAELQVLQALLCRQQSFVAVARARGTETNTVKAQKQTAFLKLRVRTWSGALNWGGDGV
ncbi:TPA: hypothetical protein ACGQS5_004791 [Serratia liquefaciens]